MRSMHPTPGNPWPHDMLITVENSSHTLLELLWVREAWALDPHGDDLPPLLVDTPGREAASGDDEARRREWSAGWADLWHACVAHAGTPHDPTVVDRLHTTTLPQREREDLLTALVGPSWRDTFGDSAFTERYDAWVEARIREVHVPPRSGSMSPEHDSVAALVPAWRAGLTRIVAIPCRGSHTRRLGPSALLVTEATRHDPAAYAGALRSFA